MQGYTLILLFAFVAASHGNWFSRFRQQRLLQRGCRRPSTGCRHPHDRYKSVDCDGDGIPDHVCTTTINKNRWLVLSSEGCPRSWGSGSRPASKCTREFGNGQTWSVTWIKPECKRPTGGCRHLGAHYVNVDCDGDGVKDHACFNTANNNLWLVLSSEGCPSSWGTHLRPVSKCKKAFGSCQDKNHDCSYWARTGECTKNPRWMLVNCVKSCRKC